MENILNKLVAEIKNNLAHDLKQCNYELLKLVLDAYNTYQKEEQDGLYYIFDINKPEDLKWCIENGMTAREIAWLYDQSQGKTTPFFYFGVNHEKPKPIATYNGLVIKVIKWMDNVLPCVLAYPYLLKSYEELYKVCITDYMINNQLVP